MRLPPLVPDEKAPPEELPGPGGQFIEVTAADVDWHHTGAFESL